MSNLDICIKDTTKSYAFCSVSIGTVFILKCDFSSGGSYDAFVKVPTVYNEDGTALYNALQLTGNQFAHRRIFSEQKIFLPKKASLNIEV